MAMISSITIEDLKKYAQVTNNDDDTLFTAILASVKAYIIGYTGLTSTDIDLYEDLVIVVYIISNELYDNRVYSVDNDKVNVIAKSILDLHCVNLL